MAIFDKSDIANKSNQPDSSTTIITVGSSMKGDMTLSCNLYIDGTFDGTITSTNEINVGKNGHVKADVKAHKIIIQGLVDGTVCADSVEIKAGGRVSGSIESAEFIIESKGIFEGTSIVKNLKDSKEKTIFTKDKADKL